MAQVFTSEEIVEAMKVYLPQVLEPGEKFDEQDAQEWQGMPLRKSSLRAALNELVSSGYLIKNEDNFKISKRPEDAKHEPGADLFDDDLVVNRMFLFIVKRFADEETPRWSEEVAKQLRSMTPLGVI
jgi:hypothetical protein